MLARWYVFFSHICSSMYLQTAMSQCNVQAWSRSYQKARLPQWWSNQREEALLRPAGARTWNRLWHEVIPQPCNIAKEIKTILFFFFFKRHNFGKVEIIAKTTKLLNKPQPKFSFKAAFAWIHTSLLIVWLSPEPFFFYKFKEWEISIVYLEHLAPPGNLQMLSHNKLDL